MSLFRLRRHSLAGAGFAAVSLFAVPAFADDTSPIDLSFNVGAATDYVWRGVSQTDENPQISGGVDATVGGLVYAGGWLSNVDFGNDTDFELDLYAGVKPQLGPVTLDLGVIYYGYINAPTGSNQDFVEFKLAGSVPAGPATVGAAVYYSDDFFGGTGKATYFEVNGS
ncbi:MAG: TorF family putative porin, partial [Phenylobacterium sp.]